MVTVTVLALLLASPLAIPETEEAAEAVRLYGDLEYEAADPAFRAIADNKNFEPEARATAWLWVALCEAGVGSFDVAKETMVRALRLHPAAELPTVVSPKVVELFDQARTEATRPGPPVDLDALGGSNNNSGGGDTSGGQGDGGPAALSLSPLLLAGGGVAVAGLASVVTGIVFGVVAQQQVAVVDDPATFQDDAKRALDDANTSAALGIITGVLGTVLLAGGAALVVIALSEPTEDAPAAATR
jgi:hypothetical protein